MDSFFSMFLMIVKKLEIDEAKMKNKMRCTKSPSLLYLMALICLAIFPGKSTSLFAQESVLVSETVRNEMFSDPMVIIKDQVAKCFELLDAIPKDKYVEVNDIFERGSSLFPDKKGLKSAVTNSLKKGRDDVKIKSPGNIINQADIRITVELRFLQKSNIPLKVSSWSEYLSTKSADEIAEEIHCIEITFDVCDNNGDTLKFVTVQITPDKVFGETQRKVLWKSFIKGFLSLNSNKQEKNDQVVSSSTNQPLPPEQKTPTLPESPDVIPSVGQPEQAEVLVLSEMRDLEIKFHVSNEAGKNYKERPFLPERNMRNDLGILLKPNEFYEIELINRSDNDLVAKIFLDGLNACHFKDDSKDPSLFLVRKHETMRVKGWYKNNKQSWAFAVSEYTPDSPQLANQSDYKEFLEQAKDVIDNSPNLLGDYSGIIVIRYTRASDKPFSSVRGGADRIRMARGPILDVKYEIKPMYLDNFSWENIPIFYRSPNENETIEKEIPASKSSSDSVPEADNEKQLAQNSSSASQQRGSAVPLAGDNATKFEYDYSDMICPQENRWGLFIISGSEENPFIKSNIQNIRNTFLKMGILENHILVMSDTAADKALIPTAENIRNQLKWVNETRNPGPLAIQKRVDIFHENSEIGLSEVWLIISLPHMKNKQDEGAFTTMDKQNTVSLEEIRRALDTSQVTRRFLLLCQQPLSGKRGGRATSENFEPIREREQQIIRDSNQTAFVEFLVHEDIFRQAEGKTNFVSIFNDAMAGVADNQVVGNKDGYVSSNELISYLNYYANQTTNGNFRIFSKSWDFPLTEIPDGHAKQFERSNNKVTALKSLNTALTTLTTLNRIEGAGNLRTETTNRTTDAERQLRLFSGNNTSARTR